MAFSRCREAYSDGLNTSGPMPFVTNHPAIARATIASMTGRSRSRNSIAAIAPQGMNNTANPACAPINATASRMLARLVSTSSRRAPIGKRRASSGTARKNGMDASNGRARQEPDPTMNSR